MIRYLLLVLAVLALPQLAVAGPINSTSQGTFGSAQNVNGFFTTNFLLNVQDSTTIAHVEINQAGRTGGAGYDFYTFTHGGGTVHLDIDDRSSGGFFDTMIGIWNAGGTLISSNDDNSLDSGDTTGLNSRINNLNLAAGNYVVGVARFFASFQSGSPFIQGNQIPEGGGYTLNISANSFNAVPVPSSLVLLGTGLLAVGAVRLRRLRLA